MTHARRYKSPAKVIPLHPHVRNLRRWAAIGTWLLAIATIILIAASIPAAWRSVRNAAGTFVPSWLPL